MKMYKNLSRFILPAFIALLGDFALTDARADIIYHESGGMVVGEAELYSSRSNYISAGPTTNGWFTVPDETAGAGTITNARGGAYIQVLPDDAGGGGGPNTPPEVMYQMKIYTPGIYRFYIRREANMSVNDGGNSDSMFFDIMELKDGVLGDYGSPTNQIADWYETSGGQDGDFATTPWNTICGLETNVATATGSSADWLIPTQGIYTLRFTQREDGAAVDAWVFQLKSLPAPTGDGPATSALEHNRTFSLAVEDTYLRRGDADAGNGSVTDMLLKNDTSTGPAGYDRIIYLRFDISALSDLEGMTLTNATLGIDLINEGIMTNHNIYVAAIAEDATAETFDEDLLTPNTSDVWNDLTDEAVDFSKVFGGAALGSFLITESDQYKTVIFDAPGLLNAIRADTDGVLSLVLYRTMDNSNTDVFASKEHATLDPPSLEVNFRPEKFGSIILIR